MCRSTLRSRRFVRKGRVVAKLTRVLDGWVNHPSIDYAVTAVVAAAALTLDPRDLLLSEQHGDWYQTLATVTGALVGVAGIAITLVLTVTPNDRLERVLGEVGPNLGRLVMSCVGGLVLATAGFAGMFLLETSSHASRVGATAFLLAFSALRFARLWRLFLAVITVLTTPLPKAAAESKESTASERPVVKPGDYSLPRRRPKRARSDRSA